ncbi:MAG: hypothetical protein VR64_11565 [Desulfatitalea sp. BRH_c12]|nr:MAG: hypothetical protein VR64_11565 [Desulfatitalea sp. BRH_c12]
MSDRNITVLALGALPKAWGGGATHGLATGIFDLVDAINSLHMNVAAVLCAPDYRKKIGCIGATTVIGTSWSVLCAHAANHPLRTLRYAGLALLFRWVFGMTPLSTFGRFLLYDYAFGKVKPDYVSAHTPGRAILAMYLSGIDRRRIIVRVHGIAGMDPNIRQAPAVRRQERFCARQRFAAVTHISSMDRKQWQHYYGKWQCRNEVILNGFRNEIFNANGTHPTNPATTQQKDHAVQGSYRLHLATVASLKPHKGQLLVIRALAAIDHKEKFQYICIGEGQPDYRKRLLHEAHQNDVDLKMLGYLSQKDIATILKQVDFMILPSSSEGFGKVFLESIACGTPVIIPRTLPLAQETGILNDVNAIFLESIRIDDIRAVLGALRKPVSSRKDVAGTVVGLTWERAARAYVALISSVDKTAMPHAST